MDRKKIRVTLKKYVKKINAVINPQQVILYGSFARGTATEWSDIDLMVITDFDKKKEFELMNKLSDIGSTINNDHIFDVRISSMKDFNNISHLSILSEIKKEGIVLYAR